MELEVEDDDDNEEYIDINESRITYGGDDNLLDKTNLQGDHMDEAEEENNEIDSHPAQRHFTTTNEESNEPTDKFFQRIVQKPSWISTEAGIPCHARFAGLQFIFFNY